MPYVYGQADWASCRTPGAAGYAELRDPDCSLVVGNPGVEAELYRAPRPAGTAVGAILSAVWVPTKVSTNPFWVGLQGAVGGRRLWRVGGSPAIFGTATWPTGRIYPSEANADRLVAFAGESATLRAFDVIFLDEATPTIPLRYRGPLGLAEDVAWLEAQAEHARYMTRLVSGLARVFDGAPRLIGNTAGWTHPALDAIAVECHDPAHGPGGKEIGDARQAAELQMRIGRNRAQSIAIWGGAATPAYSMIEGRWLRWSGT